MLRLRFSYSSEFHLLTNHKQDSNTKRSRAIVTSFYCIKASFFADILVMMVLQNCVWNMTVRDDLNRAVVVFQLLGSYDVRVVSMNCAIDANNALYDARNGAEVVRYHDDCHALI